MARRELSKAERKELNRLVDLAYSRALSAELEKLYSLFADWRGGDLDPFDLSAAIHRFHDGPARDLYKLYALADNAMLDTIVKGALARGLLENIARADARNPSQMEMTPYLG
jgi:hypothetical protein